MYSVKSIVRLLRWIKQASVEFVLVTSLKIAFIYSHGDLFNVFSYSTLFFHKGNRPAELNRPSLVWFRKEGWHFFPLSDANEKRSFSSFSLQSVSLLQHAPLPGHCASTKIQAWYPITWNFSREAAIVRCGVGGGRGWGWLGRSPGLRPHPTALHLLLLFKSGQETAGPGSPCLPGQASHTCTQAVLHTRWDFAHDCKS